MEEQAMSSSDIDGTSQTETEDADTVENSESSIVTESSVTMLSDTHECSKKEDESSSGEQYGVQNISVDLTEVSDLNESASDIDQGAKRHSSKQSVESSRKNSLVSELPKIDFSSKDWYNQECFSRYWEHYRQCMSWCQKHFEVYNKLTNQRHRQQHQSNSRYPPPFPPVYTASSSTWQHPYNYSKSSSLSCSMNGAQTLNDKGKNGAMLQPSTRSRRKSKHRKRKSSTATTDTESEFEMEITQDMINFFAKSDEHRRLRGNDCLKYLYIYLF